MGDFNIGGDPVVPDYGHSRTQRADPLDLTFGSP
jgi:hypothetical protein